MTDIKDHYRYATITLFLLATSCSGIPSYEPDAGTLETGNLPSPNLSLNIANLGTCTDATDNTIHINRDHPLTILVHGCNGSAGRFRSLAQLYAFHGQQAVCYSYDDRDKLVNSANKLNDAIRRLVEETGNRDISIIGHSMGGLVARKAMEDSIGTGASSISGSAADDLNINLITVSAPLAGISVASTCGYKIAHWLSLGVIPFSCWLVTGDNWYEITSSSSFIQHPEPLQSSVRRYLKVVTDETNSCRHTDAQGNCLKSDFIFTLDEQYHPLIDKFPRVENIEVRAGHVEIVGYRNRAPRKLVDILQQNGLLAVTPPERQSALEKLLAVLY